MSEPIRLAFTGLAGVGKSTAALGALLGAGGKKVAWADPVKFEVYDFLYRYRLGTVPEEEMAVVVEGLYASLKAALVDMPLPPLAHRDPDEPFMLKWINANKEWIRPLLQWWGTDYRRSQDVTYWIKQGLAKMREYDGPLVNDDSRFENEYHALKELGFTVVRVERDGVMQMNHASEKLDIPYDLLLRNNFKDERTFIEYVRDNVEEIFNRDPRLTMATKHGAYSLYAAHNGDGSSDGVLLTR